MNSLVVLGIEESQEHRKDSSVLCTTLGNQSPVEKLDEILRFLVQCSLNHILAAWDLDQTIAPVLRLINQETLEQLYRTAKAKVGSYELFYIPTKCFIISRVDRAIDPVSIYHLSQYYPENIEPESLQETLELGNKVLDAFHTMNLWSNKLTSPIAVYQEKVMNYLDLPTLTNSKIPKEAAEWYWRCSGQLWIEAYKIGYFKMAYDYDMKSCFPNIARELLDIRYGEWIKSSKLIPEAYYGVCQGYSNIREVCTVHPIIYQNEKGELSTPTGSWHGFQPLCKVNFIKRYQLGHFDLEDGWFWIPNKQVKPLQASIDKVLKWKEHENELVVSNAKRISTGIYGKFGEEHKDSFGKFFNPVWFTEISAQASLAVAEFIYKNKLMDDLIHISVDGVLVTREI